MLRYPFDLLKRKLCLWLPGIATILLLTSNTPYAQEESSSQARPPQFETGRKGLALSDGYFRGVPLGELPGWTISLWFQATEEPSGDLMGIVINQENQDIIRLYQEGDEITLNGRFRNQRLNRENPDGWIFKTSISDPVKWHQVLITYSQADGPYFYVDGKLVDHGERNWLGYATSFNNYHFGARVFPTGDIGDYYSGLLDDFELYDRAFTAEEVQRSFEGEAISAELLAFNDFENVSHRDLANFSESDRDEAYLEEGRQLYELNCAMCHSKDGITPPLNPLARAFTENIMENGGDPYSMFKTVTYGFRNMMASPQLNPEQRYKVIHFIREKMVKKLAPQLYVEVDSNYTEPMPRNPEGMGEEAARVEALAKIGYLRDYGNALITPVHSKNPGNSSRNALVINLGDETTIGYDLGTMRSIGAWQNGFLDFSNTLHHMLRAPGLPLARFDFIAGMESWRWAWDGKAEKVPPTLKPNTIYPENQIRYRGHYPYGDDIIISYAVQGRGVLESPYAETIEDNKIIHHRFSIEPGKRSLELVVLGIIGATPVIDGSQATIQTDDHQHLAWLQGDTRGLRWRTSRNDELVLQIPASKKSIHLNIALATLNNGSSTNLVLEDRVLDLTERTRGGPRRWQATHSVKGKLATDSFQGYVMDSVTVPLKNAYNTWMRTASLTFFPDGKLAVGTLSGDIWIVSGIDDTLKNITWQRFAAGLYEPMGMKVVDGLLTITTRGRIVKLHDYNQDGEADFYEAFHNDIEPVPGWHAYSFDLEIGEDGSYYFARVGQFTDWSVPGGLVRISPDGKTEEIISVGMRVPNGVGRLPDGRITYGENQGTYVPASKISIADIPGSFHGAGKWKEREGNYDPNNILDPIVYMPQELDSSSGGQLWVEKDKRFGPLGGQFFHTSFGQATTMYIMIDEFDDVIQGAVYSIPIKMESGTMRVAKNPIDGQLYYSGLTGWQAGATREGSIQRLRYTGEKGLYVLDAKARQGRLEITFNQPLDPASLKDLSSWYAEMWNYLWSSQYGSPKFLVTDPETEGTEPLLIGGTDLKDGGRKLIVSLPDMEPCHNLRLDFSVKGTNDTTLDGPLYFTIHELPE